ncbi:hypothetical protein N9954_07030 [Maribacter sp.]|nr:hypothetical protein [Maribacter sp.]
MKNLIAILLLSALIFGCKEVTMEKPIVQEEEVTMVGHWDNFQQYWLENTADDIHRTETEDKHRHFSLDIVEGESGERSLEIREGRNGKTLVETITWEEALLGFDILKIERDTLFIGNKGHFKNKDPYKFIRTRKFSGWIELPMRQYPDSIYRARNLEIHDQGGMAEVAIEGVHYTAELTQLLFGHKLAIMKLAIYDMPMDSVEINSRSISYTWLNPEAKRTGINLRKVTSGWTFIEPGFINSDNTKFDKK